MRDRLIKILSAFPVWGKTLKDQWFDKAIERLADHLLANGVIVPPCKVGDTVYKAFELCCVEDDIPPLDRCYQGKCEGCKFYEIGIETIHIKSIKDIFYWWDDFGKTVFLTKELAEEALERSGE